MKKMIAMLVAALFLSATMMAQVQPTEKKSESKAPKTEMKVVKKTMKKKPASEMKSDKKGVSKTEKKVDVKEKKKAEVK